MRPLDGHWPGAPSWQSSGGDDAGSTGSAQRRDGPVDPMSLVVVLAVVVGLPGIVGAVHLGVLALASWFYRQPRDAGRSDVRFLVLVPAHNEERVLAEGLRAIIADRRSRDQVLVVADRCTDQTPQIARSFGVLVLERGPDESAGRAAARQAGLEYARSLEWDAVLMLDADSVIEPGFFAACEQALASGAKAVQARSESGRGATWAAEASLAAFTLQGITIPRGRDRLGVSVRLRGTGMAIRRQVALAHRFLAPASEDLFFTLDLLLDGVRCRHVDAARLRSQGASTWGAFGGQKVRYEAGRMRGRSRVPAETSPPRVERAGRCMPGGGVVSGVATVRTWRALAPTSSRSRLGCRRLGARSGLRRGVRPARARRRYRPGSGACTRAHLACPVHRTVVPGVEGRDPAACCGKRPAPGPIL